MTAQAQLKNAKTAVSRIAGGLHRHPGIRTDSELSRGERAADKMRNSMGSWAFVFGALIFLFIWMAINVIMDKTTHNAFDTYPFILLNLVLSCVAALQGAILLIAAKRSDQVSTELAQHDYEADCASRELLLTLTTNFAELRAEHALLHEQNQRLFVLVEQVAAGA